MPDAPPPGWPPGVHQVSFNDVGRFGVSPKNELFWDGRRILTSNQVRLSFFQTLLALLATLATIIGGVNNASTFLCARNIRWLSCPVPAVAAPPPPAPRG